MDILSLVLICRKNRKNRGFFRSPILTIIGIFAMGWFTYVGRIINIVNIFGAKVNFGAISTNRSRTDGSCDVTKSHNMSQSGKSTFSLVVKIPVDRGWSGMHQKNRNASDSCDSDEMRLGSSGTDWDACFWTFSYIVKIRDRKKPRLLRFLGHMRTRL